MDAEYWEKYRKGRTENCQHLGELKDYLNLPGGTLKLHPICGNCGAVKNISSDRGRKISYFVAVFYRMKKDLERRGYKISDVQMRLVFKSLPDWFEDVWCVTYSTQKEVFIEAVRKYVRVSREYIESL